MLISELYVSKQGEGRLVGVPSVFIRTSGCNLRCWFCDTPFASWEPTGQQQSITQILQQCAEFADQAQHVVITGGEPMLPVEIVELTKQLSAQNFHITIETAGTLDREVACDLISISPKLANSDPDQQRAGAWRKRHQERRHRPEIVQRLIRRYDYQLKFVVDQPADLDQIEAFLAELDGVQNDHVLLMPQGVERAELDRREQWLRPICQQRGYRLCQRMHIHWYGNRRGT